MPKRHSPLQFLISIPVTLVIIGAFVLAGLSGRENLRFIGAIDQSLGLVTKTRALAAAQQQFAQQPGENLLDDLQHMGQIASSTSLNPWGGKLTAVAVTNNAMRIESDVPPHECRRLAAYFISHHPADLQLLSVEAYGSMSSSWAQIYPPASDSDMMDTACGSGEIARLALVFRFR